MDSPSTPVTTSSPDLSQPGAFPEHTNPGDGTSLIRTQVSRPSRTIVLWIFVLIALGLGGFSIYTVVQAQSAVVAIQSSHSALSDRLTSAEQKLTTLTAKVDGLAASPLPVFTLPNAINTVLPTIPTATTVPSSTISSTPLSQAPATVTPGITGDDTTSVSDGRLTVQDEKGMLAYYMQSISKGENKVSQPDNISLVKNRQVTDDKLFNYDVFKNKETDELYIYARKSATNTSTSFVDGWYGPFPAFPGA